MNKCKYILITIILIIIITNLNIVITSTKEASILFFNKIFISIFPFIILSDILIFFNYHLFLNKLFSKFLSKLFNINLNSTIIFILSMLTSHPSNAIFIKDMLDNNLIDITTANKLICFTYFPSISFVIGTIGISIYHNINIGIILWLFVLINNILIGLYLRKEKIIINKNNISNKDNNLLLIIKNSIIKGINNSFIILGTLIIFSIINNLIIKYTKPNIFIFIITGLIELTNGILNINSLMINLDIKLAITELFLCFSSLSILFQGVTILNKYNIKIKRILLIKIVFSILTSIIFYILMMNINLFT